MREIPNLAFAFCPELRRVTIGGGVGSIGDYAFYKCTNLQSLTLPDTVKAIGKSAFYKCTELKTLRLGNALETIGDYAFYGLENVRELQLPGTLKSIGKYSFKGLSRIQILYIPKGVATIGGNAFYGCYNTTFYVEDGADMSGWNIRWNSSNRPVVLHADLAEDGSYVVSVTVTEGSILNDRRLTDAITPITSPVRAGYTFDGWRREDGTVVPTSELSEQAVGTTLTALWTPVG